MPAPLASAALLAVALPFLGSAGPEVAEYRLGVQTPGVLEVELRFRGDADGETTISLPAQAAGLKIDGARAGAGGGLSHRPNARITVRYHIAAPAGTGDALVAPGEALAAPQGRDGQPAAVRWTKLPKGWTVASTLDTSPQGAPHLGDIPRSLTLAGGALQVAEQPIPGGTLRTAGFGDPTALDSLAGKAARIVGAQRGYWNDTQGPFLLGVVPGKGPDARRSGGFLLHAADPGTRYETLRRETLRAWIPDRVAGAAQAGAQPAPAWLTEGLTDFIADRILARGGVEPLDETVARMAEAMRIYDAAKPADRPALAAHRGLLLALKWDEDVRLKTGGKADLDDVMLQMRDHARRFPAGQAPDLLTGFISAMWVVARIDVRPDIAALAETTAQIPLPADMLDGCLQARVTLTPAFDAGFDTAGSFATKVVRGVVRRGPAWNSGVRDGMALDSWTFVPGDTQTQIELTVRPSGKRAKPRHIAYWPYGDATAESRRLQLTPGLTAAQKTACGRRIAGL